MTEEKQIEFEMAEMLEIIAKARKLYANDVTDHTENDYIREALLDAGYRKQVEGEWIDVHHMSRSNKGRYTSYYTYTCGVCKESNGRRKTPYCPHCGAKMKGGE